MFTDQFSNAAKINFETQMAAAHALNAKAIETVAQLTDLNLRAVRSTLEGSATTAQQVLAAKDGREALALIAAQSQPAAANLVAWSRDVAELASTAQAELTKATEEQAAASARKATELIDQLMQNAPPGMEQTVSLMKAAIANAGAGYEQANKIARQANTAFEENFGKVFGQFTGATEKQSARGRK